MDKHLQVILVECETKPSKKREFQKMTIIQNKNHSNQRRTNQTNERWLDIRKRRWRRLVFQKTQVNVILNDVQFT